MSLIMKYSPDNDIFLYIFYNLIYNLPNELIVSLTIIIAGYE